MKHASAPARPACRRVPKFTPVPLRYRADGWTPARQADFLGALAESGRVGVAARMVGMGRESAYRLRDKEGAESFAAAWDTILARPRKTAKPKSTQSLLIHRASYGYLRPVMRGGRHVATALSPDDDAVSRLYRKTLAQRARLGGTGRGSGPR